MKIFFGPAAELLLSFRCVTPFSVQNNIEQFSAKTPQLSDSAVGLSFHQPQSRKERRGFACFAYLRSIALPADPSKAFSGNLHAALFDTRKPLKQYRPAKANNARHLSSQAPVWLLSNFFQNGSGR
jgi:hypothetical protein